MPIKTIITAGVVALSALATTVPADAASIWLSAQGSDGAISVHYRGDGHHFDRGRGHWDRGYGYRRHLTPWQVRRKLRHRGFRNIHFVDRRAPVYKVRATGFRGRRVFLVVSSRTGEIIRRSRIARHR
jgi:hypothetical protein